MNATDVTEYVAKDDEEWLGQRTRRHACAVVRDGQEVQWFVERKRAGAWLMHVYGKPPYEAKKFGIEIVPFGERGPMPGDAFVYDGTGSGFWSAGRGVLERSCGELAVTFNPSAFRIGDCVSCSGGPSLWIKPESLTLIGLREVYFWRWHAGFAGADEGGDYRMMVPYWRWSGK